MQKNRPYASKKRPISVKMKLAALFIFAHVFVSMFLLIDHVFFCLFRKIVGNTGKQVSEI